MNLRYCEIAPKGWQRKRIEEVCTRVTSGGTPSRKRSDYYGGDILWVKTKELNDLWIDDTEEKITQAGLNASSAKLLDVNTVLLAMYGATVGQLGILKKTATCNQAACAMEVDTEQADFRFLFYMLLLHREQIISMASGAAQQNLSGALIKSFTFPFPEPTEQSLIADIISDLDRKVELNIQINQTLELMARTIFKSWFIDFDPVKAKLAAVRSGRDPALAAMAALAGKLTVFGGKPKFETLDSLLPLPEAIDEAIEQLDSLSSEQRAKLVEYAAQFPDEFVESDLGLVPRGWEAKAFYDVCSLNSMSWTKRNKPSIVEYVDLANAKHGDVISTETYEWDEAPSRARRIIRNGDTIVGTVRPANRSFALVDDDRQLTASTGFAALSPHKSIYREFVYLHVTSDENFNRLSKRADGAAYPAVRPDVVGDFMVACPPNETLIEAFHHTVASKFDLIGLNRKESKTLALTRKTLLPKLMSGEITLARREVSA